MLHRIIRYSVNEFAYNEGLIGRYAGFVISREDCILLAIFCICMTIAFCVGLWIWQFFRSTNHAISLMVNYYSVFNTRLKNIEQSINNLNSILNSVPAS